MDPRASDPARAADSRLDAAMARFAPTAEWRAEPMAEGLTNQVWRVRITGGPDVVVQVLIDADRAEDIGIVRQLQYTAARIGADLGISPAILGLYQDLDVVVSEFVAGGSFPASGPRRLRAILDVARALRALHAVPTQAMFFNDITVPMAGNRLLIERARAADPAGVAEIEWALAPLERIEACYQERDLRLVHNDLVETNVLVGDVTRLIDWEYCGLGDPYSDLGDFAGKCELTVDEEVAFITAYADEYDEAAHAWLRVYRYINVLREGMWAIPMLSRGKDGTDYAAYARRRFAQVRSYVSTSEFSWALSSLEAGRSTPIAPSAPVGVRG